MTTSGHWPALELQRPQSNSVVAALHDMSSLPRHGGSMTMASPNRACPQRDAGVLPRSSAVALQHGLPRPWLRQARSCAEASKRGIWRPSGGVLNWFECRKVWMRVVTARVSRSLTCMARCSVRTLARRKVTAQDAATAVCCFIQERNDSAASLTSCDLRSVLPLPPQPQHQLYTGSVHPRIGFPLHTQQHACAAGPPFDA